MKNMVVTKITQKHKQLYYRYRDALIEHYKIEDVNNLTRAQRELLTSLYIDQKIMVFDQADMLDSSAVELITKAMRQEISPRQLTESLINKAVEYHRHDVDEDYQEAVTDHIQESRPWECESEEDMYGRVVTL